MSHLSANQETYNVKASIPEYYNLMGVVHGNIQQVAGQVDAKLMGDIDLQITHKMGNFIINKVKS